MGDALELTPDEIAEVQARREQRKAEAEAEERARKDADEAEARAEAEAAERAKKEASAKAAAIRARRDVARKDEADAYAIVHALTQIVDAVQSVRSRLGDERDATAATGHLIGALLAAGGTLGQPETQPHAIRHALGGESEALRGPERAAVALATILLEALIAPKDDNAIVRAQTSSEVLHAIADIWTGHDRMATAREQVEAVNRDEVAERARQHADAHAERLGKAAAAERAKAAGPPRQPRPQHRALPVATDAAGVAERKRLERLHMARGLPPVEPAPAEPFDLGGEVLGEGDGAFVPEGSVEGLSEKPE